MDGDLTRVVLVRARESSCALRLEDAIETLRPLRLEPVAGAPLGVLGLGVVRGDPLPVIDLGVVLGATSPPAPTRWVTMRAGNRRLALAVEAVHGIVAVPTASFRELPPLVRPPHEGALAALGVRDGAVLALLEASRFLTEATWSALARATAGGAL